MSKPHRSSITMNLTWRDSSDIKQNDGCPFNRSQVWKCPQCSYSCLLNNVFRSEAFENPVIQKHYRNLEALALDMMAPEDTEDLISKIQTDTCALSSVWVHHFAFFVTLHISSSPQCQRWSRWTSGWATWLWTLKIWSTLPTTILRANQPQNEKQVRALCVKGLAHHSVTRPGSAFTSCLMRTGRGR